MTGIYSDAVMYHLRPDAALGGKPLTGIYWTPLFGSHSLCVESCPPLMYEAIAAIVSVQMRATRLISNLRNKSHVDSVTAE